MRFWLLVIAQVSVFVAAICGAVWLVWAGAAHEASCHDNPVCLVDNVGGCDRNGECGVKCVEGQIGTAQYPVVGAFAQIRVKLAVCKDGGD